MPAGQLSLRGALPSTARFPSGAVISVARRQPALEDPGVSPSSCGADASVPRQVCGCGRRSQGRGREDAGARSGLDRKWQRHRMGVASQRRQGVVPVRLGQRGRRTGGSARDLPQPLQALTTRGARREGVDPARPAGARPRSCLPRGLWVPRNRKPTHPRPRDRAVTRLRGRAQPGALEGTSVSEV